MALDPDGIRSELLEKPGDPAELPGVRRVALISARVARRRLVGVLVEGGERFLQRTHRARPLRDDAAVRTVVVVGAAALPRVDRGDVALQVGVVRRPCSGRTSIHARSSRTRRLICRSTWSAWYSISVMIESLLVFWARRA